MEIIDYFRAIGARFWVLILLPLIGGGIPAALLVSEKPVYVANATITAPALVGGIVTDTYNGAEAAKQFASDLQGALQLPEVQDEIGTKAGIKRKALSGNLRASEVLSSTFVQVAFKTTKRKDAVAGAQVAAEVALDHLFSSQVAIAKAPYDQAVADSHAAEDQLAAFIQSVGSPDEVQTYLTAQRTLAHISESITGHLAVGDTAQADRESVILAQGRADLVPLRERVIQFEHLRQNRNLARTRLDQTQRAFVAAEAQLGAANPSDTIRVGHAKRFIDAKSWGTAIGGGMAAGLVLALLVTAVFDVRRAIRRRRLAIAAGWVPAA